MQITIPEKRIPLVVQACTKVEGFAQLHQRFKQKMSIIGRAESTMKNYSIHLAQIALHFDRIPTLLTIEEIESYLYYTQQKYNSPSEVYFKHTVYSLRFVFRMEGLNEKRIQLPVIRRSRKLPVILSKYEMAKLLNQRQELKYRAILALLYGCGLRCFEVRNIKLNDLDFHRSTLHVRQGKGKKDRYVPLGNFLVTELTTYIETYHPKTWLFNGKPTNRSKERDCRFSKRAIYSAVKRTAKKAGITKYINVHTLRHTFATHLLEDGLDIVSIKELLGHSKIETTLIYLHVAQMSRKEKFSPIDNLQGIRISRGIQYKLEFKPGEDVAY